MQEIQVNPVTLVLGGVRSGKSRYAQQLAARHARVTVIATARRSDDEMNARIDRHQLDRPTTWTTVEEPVQLPAAIRSAATWSDVILVDCLTLYAANLLHLCGSDTDRLDAHFAALGDVLREAPCNLVLVANEVGSGIVPAYELGRRFRDVAGELNQRVAAIADNVLLMVAGLPLVLKGAA
ncbi:adenosylcobinamide kinase /adenosylcobinamide-phosphate guanylyltransferase [Granulicella rosea]|uniref:Adenosylcobinamide kinase n=1 Tax=Granulicella rosea TaxID=474952 RepID=A0A239IM86_9BACT|nr:bifunctional adenosylcobinamide kinase/adenosylcobinamide-phosphate guanylyltransferase [Granulicella rosea]SNS94707.1 adenosylcobinamide kinase /adenosylcobinamide-phosphate guanylyltransferase [Granulicella rosea]